MKALCHDEVISWIKDLHAVVVPERALCFASSVAEPLHFHYPTGEGQLAYFARALLSLHHEESSFAGALLWYTQWGVWSAWAEEIGCKTVAMLRGQSKGLALLAENPAQLFSE